MFLLSLQAVGWFLLMASKQLYKWAGGLNTFLYTLVVYNAKCHFVKELLTHKTILREVNFTEDSAFVKFYFLIW